MGRLIPSVDTLLLQNSVPERCLKWGYHVTCENEASLPHWHVTPGSNTKRIDCGYRTAQSIYIDIIIISIMSCLYVCSFFIYFIFTRCIKFDVNTYEEQSLYCHCIVQKTMEFGNSITTHTRATILLMTYMFINIQINLTMTSQRTNHLNDSWNNF